MPSVVFDRVMVGLLTCAAVAVGVLSAGFAPQRFFGEQIPVVAVLVGLTNLVLLWLASGFSRGPGRVAPLIAWLLTLMVAAMAGPGRDEVLPLDGTDILPTFLLVVVGAGVPLVALWSGRLNTRQG
ncbi:facilitated glucose transporter [Gordonia amarae]|nr:facilitated glucose transporter [Gordonia amarae]QHN24454.1 facilitated glucose transporter [Gordonia amarae]QHN33379.1 facilitated glucose transporter [Gordonia amarae]QHN42101.1 facilitated glucose transporter [Gordonia amarae]